MPCIEYEHKKFRPKSLAVIDQANEIINDYTSQGFDLTLRQLYYQFVARDLVPNTERSYKSLGSIINDGRLAGLIDWDSITDRTRELKGNAHWDSPQHIIRSAARGYQIEKWSNQDYKVEVWIEKDALIGVISAVCKKLDVDYFSCRGYVSQSEMWNAGHYRYTDATPTIILHLGDHDPSGIDMTRDIQSRLSMFSDGEVEVVRIALNMDQVEQYGPPPNPAKVTDARFNDYSDMYGDKSWELDALEPRVLADLVEKHVLEYRDEDLWQESVDQENVDKEKLSRVVEALKNDEI